MNKFMGISRQLQRLERGFLVLMVEEIWRTNQLRLVVYPIVYSFFFTSQVVETVDDITTVDDQTGAPCHFVSFGGWKFRTFDNPRKMALEN